MLSSEDREILNEMRKQMSPEQKKIIDALSDDEKQSFLEEMKTKIGNMSQEEIEQLAGGEMSGKSEDDMGYWETIRQYGGESFIGASLGYLIKKKPGCGCLLVIIIGIVLWILFKNAN